MTLGFTVMGVSAGMIVLLMALFRVEEANGRRVILPRMRASFDAVVVWIAEQFSNFARHIGGGVIRVTFHYLIHKSLGVVIKLLTKAQERLARVQLRNKRIVTVQKNSGDKNHLDAIATFKEENSLTDEEIRRRRSH